MPGRQPDLQFQPADAQPIAFVDFVFDFDRQQFHIDALRRDFGKAEQPVAAAERVRRHRMSRHVVRSICLAFDKPWM